METKVHSGIKIPDIKEEDVDPKELDKGIADETEHTDDKDIAKIIALCHLQEIPDYYTRLNAMKLAYEMEKKRGEEPVVPTDKPETTEEPTVPEESENLDDVAEAMLEGEEILDWVDVVEYVNNHKKVVKVDGKELWRVVYNDKGYENTNSGEIVTQICKDNNIRR